MLVHYFVNVSRHIRVLMLTSFGTLTPDIHNRYTKTEWLTLYSSSNKEQETHQERDSERELFLRRRTFFNFCASMNTHTVDTSTETFSIYHVYHHHRK